MSACSSGHNESKAYMITVISIRMTVSASSPPQFVTLRHLALFWCAHFFSSGMMVARIPCGTDYHGGGEKELSTFLPYGLPSIKDVSGPHRGDLHRVQSDSEVTTDDMAAKLLQSSSVESPRKARLLLSTAFIRAQSERLLAGSPNRYAALDKRKTERATLGSKIPTIDLCEADGDAQEEVSRKPKEFHLGFTDAFIPDHSRTTSGHDDAWRTANASSLNGPTSPRRSRALQSQSLPGQSPRRKTMKTFSVPRGLGALKEDFDLSPRRHKAPESVPDLFDFKSLQKSDPFQLTVEKNPIDGADSQRSGTRHRRGSMSEKSDSLRGDLCLSPGREKSKARRNAAWKKEGSRRHLNKELSSSCMKSDEISTMEILGSPTSGNSRSPVSVRKTVAMKHRPATRRNSNETVGTSYRISEGMDEAKSEIGSRISAPTTYKSPRRMLRDPSARRLYKSGSVRNVVSEGLVEGIGDTQQKSPTARHTHSNAVGVGGQDRTLQKTSTCSTPPSRHRLTTKASSVRDLSHTSGRQAVSVLLAQSGEHYDDEGEIVVGGGDSQLQRRKLMRGDPMNRSMRIRGVSERHLQTSPSSPVRQHRRNTKNVAVDPTRGSNLPTVTLSEVILSEHVSGNQRRAEYNNNNQSPQQQPRQKIAVPSREDLLKAVASTTSPMANELSPDKPKMGRKLMDGLLRLSTGSIPAPSQLFQSPTKKPIVEG